MGRMLTNAEFKARLKVSNPDVTPLEEYKGAARKIRCRCRACSYEWAPRANSLLLGHGCPRCKGLEKYDAREFAKKIRKTSPGVTALEPYANSRTRIECRCDACGNVWKVSPYVLLHHAVCPACVEAEKAAAEQENKMKTSMVFLKRMEKISPGIEITGTYTMSHKKIGCRCRKCGHEWMAFPNNLLHGHGCPNCAPTRKLTDEEYRMKAQEKNPDIEILDEYRGYKSRIGARCRKCGYEWRPLASQILSGHGCPACKGVRRYTTESFKEKLENVNPDIQVLGEYVSSQKKILCRCRICSHEWTPLPCNILNNGTGCPSCAQKKRSALMKEKRTGIGN